MRSTVVKAKFKDHSLVVDPTVEVKLNSFNSSCIHYVVKELVLAVLTELGDRVSHLPSMLSYLKLTTIEITYTNEGGKESYCFKHDRRVGL